MEKKIVYVLKSTFRDTGLGGVREYFLDKNIAEEVEKQYKNHYVTELVEEEYYVEGIQIWKLNPVGTLFDEDEYIRKQELKDSIKTKLTKEELKYLNLI